VPMPVPRPVVPPIDKSEPEPVEQLSEGWLPPTNVILPDVTCRSCWGFTQSLGVAQSGPWMQSE